MKKVLLSILALSLVAILSVGATLAYLQDEDGAVNVMTVGQAKIEQHEYQRAPGVPFNGTANGNLVEFVQGQPLRPAVPTGDLPYTAAASDLFKWQDYVYTGTAANGLWDENKLGGNVLDKFVFVENTGAVDVYFRTVIAFECPVGMEYSEGSDKEFMMNVSGSSLYKWDKIGYTEVDGTRYLLMTATYLNPLKPGQQAHPSLLQVLMTHNVTNEDIALLGNSYEILVMSQAVQADGFKAGSKNALDTAFGAITETAHPWADKTIKSVSDTAELKEAVANGATTLILADGEYTLPATAGNTLTIVGGGDDVVIDLTAATGQDLMGTNINFANVTVKGKNSDYIGIQHCGDIVYTDCVFDASTTLYGESATFNNCVFNLTSRYIWTYGAKEVTFNNCVFNTDGKALLVYAEAKVDSQVVNVNNCTFNATKTAKTGEGDDCAAVEIDGSLIKGTYTVNFNGKNVVDSHFAGLYRIKKQKTPANVTVNENGKTVTTTVASNADELAAALTANNENIEIVLKDNIDLPINTLGAMTGGSGEYKLGGVDTESIVIDLNGKKLNVTTTYWSNLGAKNENATFTIKNGTMTSSQPTGTWNSYDLSFSNCNYVFENVKFGKAVALSNAGKSVVMNDVEITETHDYYALWITAEGQYVEINGLTVKSAGRGIKIDEQYVDTAEKVTLKVSDADFNTAKKAAILVKSVAGAYITLDNVDISGVAADKNNPVWVDADAAAYVGKVTVTGGSVITEN